MPIVAPVSRDENRVPMMSAESETSMLSLLNDIKTELVNLNSKIDAGITVNLG